MKKATELLLNKMKEDKAFAEKVIAQTETEKVIEIAKNEGIELTIENIDEVNEVLRQVISKQSEGELSEEELENVAGGTFAISAMAAITVSAAGASFVSAATYNAVSISVSLISLVEATN
ncbi:MAG: Nif11-like leader peptide family natural product precursor [Peptostreptococcaceae bacterium]|nr:Nif11-like leader peptide family natural product precursor [Peptostreptococcaceae bacterium]